MFLAFGFALPLLTAGLFFFAFGGSGFGNGEFELPPTQVQVVNLDRAQMGFSTGTLLVQVLESAVPDVVQVSEAADAASARAAVDHQQAAVAVIIPPDLTAALFDPEGQAAVELYQDPTLSLGPGIVKEIVGRIIDGLAGSRIATTTAYEQLSAQGLAVDAPLLQGIGSHYAAWAETLGEEQQAGTHPFLDLESLAGAEEEGADSTAFILGLVMAGMMVFYVFTTGAASAQSILQEEEEGTLPRLFTTPTPQSSILGGKFLAGFVLLAVQVVVLVVISHLLFGIDWGEPLPVALVTVGLVLLAASFGLFLISWLKNARQAGIVIGGVMTVLGMIGMVGAFTAGVPGASKAVSNVALVTPHGWAIRGWQLLLEGGGVEDVLPTVALMLALAIAFFVVGVFRFRARYA